MSCGPRLAQQLRNAGFRLTPQRNVILETVAHMGDHLPVQQVFEVARQRLPGLNLATVYRTLDTLCKAGLVDLLSSEQGLLRYSLRDPSSPHAHLVCSQCGDILDIDLGTFDRLTRELKQQHGFAADISHLALIGMCQRCQGKDKQQPLS
jgi:Fe2+ or Zn2+ uptake regulation protein